MEADGAKKYAAAFLMKEVKKVEERQANGTSASATSTMTTKENGNLADKVVADNTRDVDHQNGVDREKQLGMSYEKANTSGMQDEGDDNNMNEI